MLDPEEVAALWDDARLARLYDELTRQHDRYQVANEHLAARAALFDGASVVDLAAGTGLTAAAAGAPVPRSSHAGTTRSPPTSHGFTTFARAIRRPATSIGSIVTTSTTRTSSSTSSVTTRRRGG